MDNDRKKAQESFKEMSFKEKWVYFWEYYKAQTLTVVIVMTIAISIIGSFTFNKAPEKCLQVGIRTNRVDLDAVDQLSAQLQEQFPDLTENGEKVFSVAEFYTGYRAEQMQEVEATMYRFSGSIAAGTLDVVIGDEETMKNDAIQQVYKDLREIFSEEELEQLAAASQQRAQEGHEGILKVSYDLRTVNGKVEEKVEDVPYFICVAGNEQIDQCLMGEPAYIGIIRNAANMDNVKEFIWSLLGENAD